MHEITPCRTTLLTTPLQPRCLPHAMPSQLLILVACSLACQQLIPSFFASVTAPRNNSPFFSQSRHLCSLKRRGNKAKIGVGFFELEKREQKREQRRELLSWLFVGNRRDGGGHLWRKKSKKKRVSKGTRKKEKKGEQGKKEKEERSCVVLEFFYVFFLLSSSIAIQRLENHVDFHSCCE